VLGRTWKNVDKDKAEEIRKHLLECGGTEEKVKSPHEVWRIKFSDSTFTFYSKGTLYATPSPSSDPAVMDMWKYIDSLYGSRYVLPSKEFLIGLDETGKGEVIGHTFLTGVIFPKEIFYDLDLQIGPADTKKRHEFEYWDKLFGRLDHFRRLGFEYIIETIPPWHVDKYNLNKIMDVVYQRILSTFFRKVDMSRCRIVLDDYGIGPILRRFFNFLKMQGAEIVVTHNADELYLEAKAASLISKRFREAQIKRINENPEFQINGLSVGSGNAGDMQTLNWLERWYSVHKSWPWFVKRSFKTVKQIEGDVSRVEKESPPIREELLSKEFIEEFNEGHLSIKSLSVFCPSCGSINNAMTFAIYKKNNKEISGLQCPSCKKIVEDAGITLRYYCGYVVPDSSIILRRLISKDLERSGFFEGFTIVIPRVVKEECDAGRSGKKEFAELAKFASMGRIRLEVEEGVEEDMKKLSSLQRDERIVNTALMYNAILITADNTMKLYAISKKIFTIFI